MIAKSHRWQYCAVAAALIGLWGPNALALSLGRVTVQSALGEPLRAEVDVPDINAEEAASLKAAVASPEAFKAAGLDYNPAMASLQVTLQKRPDGRSYIRVSSERSINDPFVDMVLEVSWASGRIVRDYTLLFDPPHLRQAASAAPSPAQTAAASPLARPVSPESASVATPERQAVQAGELRKAAPGVSARPSVPATPGSQTGQVSVKTGDTASKIAAAIKPAKVSLDQMLVALLRANPTAFIGDNVNRVKAGAVMNIPTLEQVVATPPSEASQIIVAQSRDFNEFRRRLAVSAPVAVVAAAERRASGAVQGKVEDKSTAKAAPDKLTLSKGAVAKQSAEDQLAKQRSAKEAANRATELSKNISDLSKLGAASSAAAPMSAAQPASALAAVATAASAAVARAAGSSPVSAPAAKRPAAVPAPAEELGLIDELLANPLLPAGAVGLMVLLAALGFYKVWQRKKGAAGGTDALKDSLRPDSFFGASGGQSVDTSDSSVATGSSIVFSASQMDAADEVDPVAEADVYLAYGRDQQAEEILKDALRINPGRVAIHQKLLELYAKRRDVKAFESIAALAFKATKGQGAQWEHICDLGKTVDADNPLYQPGGEPNRLSAATTVPGSLDDTKSRTDSSATAAEPAAGAASGASVDLDMDLDLDLDFSLDEESAGAAGQTTGSVEGALSAFLDLDVSMPAPLAESSGAPEAAASADSNAIEFTLPAVEIEQSEALAQASAEDEGAVQPTAVPAPPNLDMLDFDMGSLSLDLEEPANPESGTEAMAQEDPLATKLALAEEFRAIGDDDGARALIEEVMAEALGDMKVKAERALTRL